MDKLILFYKINSLCESFKREVQDFAGNLKGILYL